MTMHGAYIYLSLFYFVYIFFLRITLLTGESNVNILIQTILSFKFYPNRHHLYTFLVIGKHHLLNLLLRFSQHRIQRIGRATVHFYILDKYQYFVYVIQNIGKLITLLSAFPATFIPAYTTKQAFHCISIHFCIENDKFRYFLKNQ